MHDVKCDFLSLSNRNFNLVMDIIYWFHSISSSCISNMIIFKLILMKKRKQRISENTNLTYE